jgi:hypothetical protein
MAQQTVDIGSIAGDGTGDPLRDAFTKINENFTELYSTVTSGGLTYGNIQSNVNGITFNVTRLAESYTAQPVLRGTSQVVGNVYVIRGNVLGGTTPFNDVFLTVTALANVSLGSIANVSAAGVPAAPVLRVNNQTGNIFLTVAEITGAASRAYVDASISANLSNVTGVTIDTINANMAAANTTISNHAARINSLESNSAAQAVQINSLVTIKANVAYVDSVVDNALGNAAVLANLNLVNANVAAANIRIQTIDANLGSVTGNITSLTSNASSQAVSLNALTANAASQSLAIANLVSNTTFISLDITNLWDNAAFQASNLGSLGVQVIALQATNANILANLGTASNYIDALQANVINIYLSIGSTNSNVNAANAAIIALQSNAAIQELAIDNLIASTSNSIQILFANAAAQATDITDLYFEAATQSASISDLYSNAASQHNQIANVNANLTTVNQNLSANIIATNAAIVTANVELKSYVDTGLTTKANVNNLIFTGNFSNGNLIILGSNVTTANSNVLIHFNQGAVFDSQRLYIKGQAALRFINQPIQPEGNPRHIVRAWTTPHPGLYLDGDNSPYVVDYERAAISFALLDANTTANISTVFIETFDWTNFNAQSRLGKTTHRYQFEQGNISLPAGGNLNLRSAGNIRFGDGSWQNTAANSLSINSYIGVKANIDSPELTGNITLGNITVSNVSISTNDANVRVYMDQELVTNGKRVYIDGQATLRFTNQPMANVAQPRHFLRLWNSVGPLAYNVSDSSTTVGAADYERVALAYGMVDAATTANISAFFIETYDYVNFNAQSRLGLETSRYQFSQGNITLPTNGNIVFGDGTHQGSAANIIVINDTFAAVNTAIVTANTQMKDYVDTQVSINITTANITFTDTTISTQNGTTYGIILNSAGNGEIAMLDYVGVNNTNPGYWIHIGDGSPGSPNNTGNVSIDFSNGLGTSRGSTILGYAWWDAGGNGNNNRGIGAHSHFGLYKNDDTFTTKFIEFEYPSGNATVGNLTVDGNIDFIMANYQHWTSNVSTISAALNQIAARLAALGG